MFQKESFRNNTKTSHDDKMIIDDKVRDEKLQY